MNYPQHLPWWLNHGKWKGKEEEWGYLRGKIFFDIIFVFLFNSNLKKLVPGQGFEFLEKSCCRKEEGEKKLNVHGERKKIEVSEEAREREKKEEDELIYFLFLIYFEFYYIYINSLL